MVEQERGHDANGGQTRIQEQPPDDRQKKKNSSWRRLLDKVNAEVALPSGLVLGGAGVIGVVVVVLAWLVFHPQSSQVEVPNLTGMPRATAEAQLKDGGLSVRAIYEEVSDQPAGMVLRSDPAAGTKLDQGAGVNLVVAATRGAIPPPSGLIVTPIPVPHPAPGYVAPAPDYAAPVPHYVAPAPDYVAPAPTGSLLSRGDPVQTPVPTATPTPVPTPTPDPVILGVGRVDHPDPGYYDCATGYRFNFSQQVSMTEPGRVTYRWLRSDQASAPVEYADFSNPGTQVVTTWWQRSGQPGDQLTGWQQIEILTPTHLTGQRINFSYTCPVPAE